MITKGLSKFKLEFTLKQHTPIIHFQATEKGATLRATELKPKLDRFLKKYFQDNKISYKTYLISGEKDAFDYQISLNQKNRPEKYYLFTALNRYKKSALNGLSFISNSPYFAQEQNVFTGKKETTKLNEAKLNSISQYGLLSKNDDLSIRFSSSSKNILESIEINIDTFFNSHNFGTRQNKGFGSFITEFVKTKVDFEKKINRIFYRKKFSGNIDALFGQIKNDYQILKSGENFNNNYKKSILFEYFCCEKKIRWEKRQIKRLLLNDKKYISKCLLYYDKRKSEKFNYPDPINCPDGKNEKENFKYIRALLGLAEQYEYKLFKDNNEDKGEEDYSRKLIISVRDECNKIQRYKSPITFKIFKEKKDEYFIYIIFDEIPSDIKGAKLTFDLELKKKVNTQWIIDDSCTEQEFIKDIEIPKDFKLENFLDFALNESATKKSTYNLKYQKSTFQRSQS